MIKIGILSFAHHHAEAYIQNLCSMPGVELIGAADEDILRGERLSKLYGARLFRSCQDLLEARPDGVVICSENNKHRAMVDMAANAKAHVLCEKPLATTEADAQAIVDVCKQNGVLLMTAFPMRFSAPLLEIKARMDNGDFGQVYCFNSTNTGELPRKHRGWFVDKELAGGGAIADHTVHLADIMRWYLNSEIGEVYAKANRIFHANTVTVETGGLVMLTFRNGVFASIDCSWCRPDYWPTWGGLTFEMVTERGAVVVDAFKQNLTIYRQDLQRASWAYWGSDMNRAMLEDFVSAIRDQRQPRVTGEDGLRAVQAVLAAYRSDQTGQPVKL